MRRRPRPCEGRAETAASAVRNRWRKRSRERRAYEHVGRRVNMQTEPCGGNRSAAGLQQPAASRRQHRWAHHNSGSEAALRLPDHIGCNTYMTPFVRDLAPCSIEEYVGPGKFVPNSTNRNETRLTSRRCMGPLSFAGFGHRAIQAGSAKTAPAEVLLGGYVPTLENITNRFSVDTCTSER